MALNLKEKLADESSDLIFPEDVFNQFIEEINSSSETLICATLEKYTGATESYTYNPFSISLKNLIGTVEHNVQDDLGCVGKEYNTNFEFSLVSSFLPDFRYRVFFACCELGGYPCKIVLEQGFTNEINELLHKDGYVYIFKDSKELSDFLNILFSSDKFVRLFKQIYAAVKREMHINTQKVLEISDSSNSEKE